MPYAPFHERFPKIAEKETRAVTGATQYSYCKAKRNLSEEV
jgi:hypothetical protein